MRIAVKSGIGQLYIYFFCFFIVYSIFALNSCSARREETPVIPPLTSPLSREYIGFGVVSSSFTHITADPSEDSQSIGYLRRGSLARIIRRQTIMTQDGFVSWVQTDSNVYGWLREDVMDIYENENQARTASESMLR